MSEKSSSKTRAISAMMKARSVALVGASDDPRKYGYMTLKTLIDGGFDGHIWPVNPKGGEILNTKVYPSLNDIPEPIDLVVVLVPAKFVPGVLEQAGELGVPAVIVTSSGFSEMGNPEGEAEILEIAARYNMHLAGPNIMGVSYLPNKMCAHFFPDLHNPGPIAIISQSGSLTNGITEWLEFDGMGICATANLGNQADLCESDFLDYFAADPNVRAVTMYLEGVKNGPDFLKALARCTAVKPVSIVKSGRSEAGRKSAESHTGSLAGSYDVFRAACRQHGASVSEGLSELYDNARALATMPVLKGDRVLVISTSGGMGTLAVDEAESIGLTLSELPEEMVRELKDGISQAGQYRQPH